MHLSKTARWTGRICALLFGVAACAQIPSAEWVAANDLYQRTEYQASLAVLLKAKTPDSAVQQLIGQNYYRLADYKKATESLERAFVLNPGNSECALWLGRAFGRRAETSSPFSAPHFAGKARQLLEKAVELDPTNREAIGDLFDYYLGAPGFLGGGEAKAHELAAKIAPRDPDEGHYYEALLADRHQQYDSAEQHLRAAVSSSLSTAQHTAQHKVGHLLDLAKFLARRGRSNESDTLFEEALRLSPMDPRILFTRAQTYVQQGRNLETARKLLEQYLRSPLTPNDPPRQEAEALLKKAGA